MINITIYTLAYKIDIMVKSTEQKVKKSTDREALEIVNKVSKRLKTEKRVYWNFLVDLSDNDQNLMSAALKELKMRNFSVGSTRRPYIEKQMVSNISKISIW